MTGILLISGSTRAGSTNTAVLRTAATLVEPGVTAELYGGLSELPAFNPDDDHDPLPPQVAALRTQIARADAVLVCTPEYAGGLPGSFKNLLDWTVGGTEMYAKPTAWINISSIAAPTGGAGAHDALAEALRYLTADVVTDACVRVPTSRAAVGPDGLVADPATRWHIEQTLNRLLVVARSRTVS